MAHYAKLGINSKVIAVNVVADKDCKNANNVVIIIYYIIFVTQTIRH